MNKGVSRRAVLLADGAILMAAAFWGVGFAVLKDTLDYLPPFTVLVVRFLIGGLMLGLVFLRHFRGLSRTSLKDGLITGILLFCAFSLQTVGLMWTTAGKQAFLTATYVVLAPLVSWGISRVFPGLRAMVASLTCLTGIWALSSADAVVLNRGDVMTLMSAFFYACHLIAVDRFTKRTDPVALAAMQMVVLGLISLPFAAFEAPSFHMPLRGWMSLLYMILFSTVGAFTIQNVAQKYTSPTHAALLLSTEAVFGAVSGVMILGERFTLQMVLGGSLVMFAILLVEMPWPKALSSQGEATDP